MMSYSVMTTRFYLRLMAEVPGVSKQNKIFVVYENDFSYNFLLVDTKKSNENHFVRLVQTHPIIYWLTSQAN